MSTDEQASTEVVRRSLDPVDQWLAAQEGYDYKVLEDGRKVLQVDQALAQRVNLLCPVSSVVQIDPNWSPQLRFTRLVANQDTYKVGTKKVGSGYEEVHSLDAPAFAKLAVICGIEHRKTKVTRWDGGMLVEVTARMRGADGIFTYRTRGRDVTFADWEELVQLEAIEKWEKFEKNKTNGKPRPTETELRKMVLTQKNFLQPSLETKAFGRCVKAFLGISTFLKPELEKPFMTVGWLMTPNLADPGVRELVKLNYAETVADLYGPDEDSMQMLERGPERTVEELDGHLDPAELVAQGRVDAETGELDAKTEPDDWSEGDPEDRPWPDKPEKHFKIGGVDVEDLLAADDGWARLAAAVKKAPAARQEQGLAWLSWKSGQDLGLEDLP